MDNLTYPLITIITMKQNTILSCRAHRDNIVLFYNFYYGSRSMVHGPSRELFVGENSRMDQPTVWSSTTNR